MRRAAAAATTTTASTTTSRSEPRAAQRPHVAAQADDVVLWALDAVIAALPALARQPQHVARVAVALALLDQRRTVGGVVDALGRALERVEAAVRPFGRVFEWWSARQ